MLALVDFKDYNVVVNNSVSQFAPDCSVRIQQATVQAQTAMTSDDGRSSLEKLFRLNYLFVSGLSNILKFYFKN